MPPSRDAGSRDAIIASVEAGFAEQIAHTRELVRFPSVRGTEHAIQDFVNIRDDVVTIDQDLGALRGAEGRVEHRPRRLLGAFAPRFAWTIVVVPSWPGCRLKPVPSRLVSEFERSS